MEGILHKTLLGGHDADVGVAGDRPEKGEATEGSVVSPSCSNPRTSFAHVLRCALPAIGELASMAILHILTDVTLHFGRCKTRAKTVAILHGGGNSRRSQNNSLSLSSSTDRCADSNHPQHTCWAESPEPARAPCLRVLRPRALPRDSNRLTAPCLHVPDAHLRRAICAHVAGR